jgi:CubicO group peptidase (beta-lactamase class C family)
VTSLETICGRLVAEGAAGAVVWISGPDGGIGAAAGADVESGEPLRLDHRFRAGSVTKTAVAAMVLLLAEDGVLGLDDRVDRWTATPHGITIRQLLQHTSGLPDYAANPVFRERFLADPTAAWKAEELLELAGTTTVESGSFGYSNTNYVVLGLVVEAAGRERLDAQLAGRIFEPLELSGTELVTGGGAAAGGLVASAADVAGLLRGVLAGELLSPPSREQLLTTVAGDGEEFARYGLGIAEMDSFLGLVPSPCGTAWGHLGLLPDCTCAALSAQDGKKQAVLMATAAPTEQFGEAMWQAFCA